MNMLQSINDAKLELLRLIHTRSIMANSYEKQVALTEKVIKAGLGDKPELVGYAPEHIGQKIYIASADCDNKFNPDEIGKILERFSDDKILRFWGPFSTVTNEYPRPTFEITLDRNFNDLCEKYIKKLEGLENFVKLYISKTEGIYINHITKKKNYPIYGKRSELLWKLKDGRKGNAELLMLYNNDRSFLFKEITAINKIFKKRLNLEFDLIKHVPTGGYQLNEENFVFEFIDT